MNITYELNPTPKQFEALKALYDNSVKFLLFGGGRCGGKSWLGWDWILPLCFRYPGIRAFVARNELKRFMTTTYLTFLKVCKEHSIPDTAWNLNSQHNYITLCNGSRIDILDVAYQPRDPMYERFGSTEYTIGWLEEIGEIKEKAFDMLKSSVGRHMNDEYNIKPKIYMTCNPKKHWAYTQFYKPWKDGTLQNNARFIQSLYKDNPYSTSDYKEMLMEIRDPVMRDRLMNGNWEYDDDEGALINYEKILDIFANQYSPGPEDRQLTSSDVARFGRDRAVIMLWDEWHIKALWYYNKSSTQFLQEKINKIHSQHHIPTYLGVVDDGGVGSGVTDYIPGINRFVAGGRPIESIDENPEDIERYSFLNLRSQCYHTLAEAINKGLVSINLEGIHIPDDDKEKGITPYDVRNWIVEELECIRKKDYEKNEKKFQVISKEDMKGLIARSPDFSDCLIGSTQILTPSGYKSIKDVKVGDKVITPYGTRKVLQTKKKKVNRLVKVKFSDGTSITCTPEHKIYQNHKFINADALTMSGDVETDNLWGLLKWRLKRLLNIRERNIGFHTIKDIITQMRQRTENEYMKRYIEESGKIITEEDCIKENAFTILMETLSIIRLKILKRWNGENTKGCMFSGILKIQHIKTKLLKLYKRFKKRQNYGISQTQEEKNINELENLRGRTNLELKKNAYSVMKRSLINPCRNLLNTAPIVVHKGKDTKIELISKKEPVIVEKNSVSEKLRKPVHVLGIVPKYSEGTLVYDIKVQHDHCYYANGILVSNCLMMRSVFNLGVNSITGGEDYEIDVEW